MPAAVDRARRASAGCRHGGFALVLALSVLAFLTLLALSLATLAKVQFAASASALKQTEARRNAWTGLRIALGKLQEHAGRDERVTCLADSFGAVDGTRDYVGVWDSSTQTRLPVTWLVSGNEIDPRAITPVAIPGDAVELVGVHAADAARRVMALRVPVDRDMPESGHYAWWVGDEGAKAPVGGKDRIGEIAYTPFDSAELRSRLRQQQAAVPPAVDDDGLQVFDASDATNDSQPLPQSYEQLPLLQRTTGGAVGLDTVRENFPHWSPQNYAVLADSAHGGLRLDLSRKPELLGAAFAAWTHDETYLEDPAAPSSPSPLPTLSGTESLRRRYRMTPLISAGGFTHSVSPLLTFFVLSFNVRRVNGSATQNALEARARMVVGLTNPYTSALVPEELRLEVDHLPNVIVRDSNGGAVTLSFPAVFGAPFSFALKWDASANQPDMHSWLPGRTYNWAAESNVVTPNGGNGTVFYNRTINQSGNGIVRATSAAYAPPVNGNVTLYDEVTTPTQLALNLVRASDGAALGTWSSPRYAAFATPPQKAANGNTFEFSFVFRLVESVDTPSAPSMWLTTAGRDPRSPSLPEDAWVVTPSGPHPELYTGNVSATAPTRFFDRVQGSTGQSPNEDVPLFELPRSPIVSMGALQHLPVDGARPFAIGNSWGAANGGNALFDRYYFSGLTDQVVASAGRGVRVLPNAALELLSSDAAGNELDGATLAANSTGEFTAKYLLARGAFNVNSTSVAAWTSMLRSARLPAGQPFTFLDALASTGTNADSATSSFVSVGATFFRFSHSAHETFKADSTYKQSGGTTPINSALFRRGMRVLDESATSALAAKVAELVRQKHAESGPFRSLEEFLGPSALFGGASLLEAAIASAEMPDGSHLNSAVAEFSSQWLTQADLMTAFAPVFFARSDSFLIRSYGDVTDPATGEVEARAWAEAIVQRLPEYVDTSQPAETASADLNTTNRQFGRRFRITAFRWLGPNDL